MSVAIIDNYLVLHCLDNLVGADVDVYKTLSITRITISSMVLVMTIFIGVSGFKQMQMCDKLYKLLKYLFYISILACIIRCISAIIADVLCVYYGLQVAAISVDILTLTSYFLLVLTLLATLLVRLNTTFYNSVYEISKSQNIIFIVLFILISLFSITSIVLYGTVATIYSGVEKKVNATIGDRVTGAFVMSGFAVSLYLFTAIWAVILFTNRLLSLINLSSNTVGNLDNIELNTSQYKLIDQISKYNALFSSATLTSVLTIIVMIIGAIMPARQNNVGWFVNGVQIISIISTIDAFFNIICLYLQYKFASKYYNKYCKYCDLCWKSIFINTTTKSLKRKSLQMSKQCNNINANNTSQSNEVIAAKSKTNHVKTFSGSECDRDEVNDALILR